MEEKLALAFSPSEIDAVRKEIARRRELLLRRLADLAQRKAERKRTRTTTAPKPDKATPATQAARPKRQRSAAADAARDAAREERQLKRALALAAKLGVSPERLKELGLAP